MTYRAIAATLVVGAAALVSMGCDEQLSGSRQPTTDPKYGQADIAAIKERWQGLAASASRSRSNRRAAVTTNASTELFPDDWIVDARTYGACDVFDLDIPLHPPITILDCVDRTEQEPGHFHIGATCIELPDDYPYDLAPHHRSGRVVYVRAGNRFRDLKQLEEWSAVTGWFEPVAVTMNGESWSFGYQEAEGCHHESCGEVEVLTLRWAYTWDQTIYNLVRDAARAGSWDTDVLDHA